MPTVALVLGSGGARGNAHIGVIQVLEEQGFDIISVSGCSMGAVVGGMYAAGKLPVFTEWVSGLSRFDVFRLVDMSLLSMGAIRGEKAYAILEDFVGDQLIEDLTGTRQPIDHPHSGDGDHRIPRRDGPAPQPDGRQNDVHGCLWRP